MQPDDVMRLPELDYFDPRTIGKGLMDCQSVNVTDEWHSFEARYRHDMLTELTKKGQAN